MLKGDIGVLLVLGKMCYRRESPSGAGFSRGCGSSGVGAPPALSVRPVCRAWRERLDIYCRDGVSEIGRSHVVTKARWFRLCSEVVGSAFSPAAPYWPLPPLRPPSCISRHASVHTSFLRGHERLVAQRALVIHRQQPWSGPT